MKDNMEYVCEDVRVVLAEVMGKIDTLISEYREEASKSNDKDLLQCGFNYGLLKGAMECLKIVNSVDDDWRSKPVFQEDK